MTSHTTGGPAYLKGIRRTQIRTPQHLNPHPTGGNLTNWNPTIPETVLTPLLTLQIDTTRAMMDPTPNLVAQMAPMDQEDQAGPGGPGGPGSPGGPGGPNSPRGPGQPGNNPPNE